MDSGKKKHTSKEKKKQNAIELSEELVKELGGQVDVIVGSKKLTQEEKRRKKLKEEKKAAKEQRKGKRAAKREALEKKKQKKIQQKVLMSEIEKKQLSTDKLTVFKSSGALGKKQTKRDKVKQAFYKEKLGIKLNEEEEETLHVKKTNHAMSSVMEIENEEEGEEKELMKEEPVISLKEEEEESESSYSESDSSMEIEKQEEKVEFSVSSTIPETSSPPPGSEPTISNNIEEEEESEEGEKKPAYADELAALEASAPKNVTVRLNDDDLEDIRRLQEDLATAVPENLRGNAYFVKVNRSEEIQKARSGLPVCGMEQEIMEAIAYHDVIIVCGETGSGKTTQIPQFLYEAGYGREESGHPGLIGITQPRRVAAVSMARRVAQELNTTCDGDGEVGYQIRYDSHTMNANSKIKFMTDGILLKEIQSDLLLRNYSAIILDEAHERNLNTDILLGLLSRVIPMRAALATEKKIASPLKLIIMSATLRVTDFQNPVLFPTLPPVIHVEARQYPVGVHFAKRTELDDYISAAYRKVVQIHKRLPEGGVLVFLTGQQEIEDLCGKLNKKWGMKCSSHKRIIALIISFSPAAVARRKKELEEQEQAEQAQVHLPSTPLENATPTSSVFVPPKNAQGEEDVEVDGLAGFSDSEGEEEDMQGMDQIDSFYDRADKDTAPMHVLPLYSLLDEKKQLRVWDPIPTGHRLVVVATNVAETSITIPNIKYVVDSGRAKEKVWEKDTGICEYKVQWISQASAMQRQGRAGRVAPGHCYRLYSAAVFQQQFAEFDVPEICRTPLEDTVLLMKHMHIANIEGFPFPTSPGRDSIVAALNVLKAIGAVNGKDEISALGEEMMKYPVGVRYAKMVVVAQDTPSVLPLVIGVISALTGRSPVIRPEELLNRRLGKTEESQESKEEEEEEKEEEEGKKGRKEQDGMQVEEQEDEELKQCRASLNMWRDASADALSLLRLLGAYLHADAPSFFCQQYFLREKTVKEMAELRRQIIRIIINQKSNLAPLLSKPITPPTAKQSIMIRQIIASAMIDHVARKMTPLEARELDIPRGKVPYVTTALNSNTPAFIHRESFVAPLKASDVEKYPDYIVFQDLVQKGGRVYLRGCCEINKAWLPRLAGKGVMCVFSDPLETPQPFFDEKKDCVMCYVSPRFGPHFWELPAYLMEFPRDNAALFKWCARLLLEGKIIPEFSILLSFYSSTPAMINKPQIPIKAMALIQSLKRENITSRAELLAAWKKNPNYLKVEISAWVLPRYQVLINTIWPYAIEGKPVPDDVLNGLKKRFGM